MVSPRHPWYGIDGYPAGVSLEVMRVLVNETLLRPRFETRICGFKEIDWPAEDFDDYIAFLRELLPGIRFIVNTRDLEATASSGWWVDEPEARDRLVRMDQQFRAFAERMQAHACHVHYDDYVAEPKSLEPLFDWLGVPFDIGVVQRVLDLPHSYATRTSPDDEN